MWEALILKSDIRTMTGLGKSVISMDSESSGSFTGSSGTPFKLRSFSSNSGHTYDINLAQFRSPRMYFGGARRLI